MAASSVSSSIDVNSIVSQLMAVESRPLTVLQSKEAAFLSKISAYGTVKGSLASFQNAVNALSSPSLFSAQSAVSSEPSVLSGSASLLATSGSYEITVNSLAKAQKLSSAAQASTITSIGNAAAATTISIQFGSVSGGTLAGGVYSGASFTADAAQATKSIVIDHTNNSLQGMRDAINRANIGVTAAIISDGAPGTPFHLTLTSTATGAASSMKISADPGADPAIAALLSYDPTGAQNFTQSVAAQNASLVVDGQTITSATNAVKDAIGGVTLNLTKVGTSTLTLSNNTQPVANAITALVKAYNDSNSTLKKMVAYDPVSKTGGLLHGDATIIAIQSKMRATLATALSGMGENKLTNITQLGVSFQKDGTLAVDNAKLQTALDQNFGDFATLFTAAGKSSDSLVSFAGSSATSMPGTYAVSVTSLATRGSASGVTRANALGGSVAPNLTIDGTNDTLKINVDGLGEVAVQLYAGTYPDAGALAAQVQTDINSALSLAGQAGTVTVSQSDGKLTIKSAAASPTASLSIAESTNTGAASLLGTPDKLSTIAAGVNDELTVAISGTTATVKLAPGSYTGASLAKQVQAAINSASAFVTAGIAVSATSANETLTIMSTRYGATSGVNVIGGNAFADLFSSAASATAGADVVGTINGLPATGSGQMLTGAGGPADGVKLLVVGGSTGARGNINFSQGYAYLLNKALDSMLGSSGALASNTDNVNKNIAGLKKRADTLTVQLTAMEKRYRTQYTALDAMLTRMGQTSQFLTQQLAALSAQTS